MKARWLLFSAVLFSFLAGATFNQVEAQPAAPVQGYPGGGATVYESPVFLNFSHSYNPGVTYNLQVATNVSFTSPIVNVNLDNSVYGYSFSTSPSTHYWWRVQTDSSGSQSAWVSTDFVTSSTSNNSGGSVFTVSAGVLGSGTGTVSKNPDSVSYHSGTVVQLTATPGAGSTFAGWSGDASGTTNPLSVTVNSSKLIFATFNGSGGGGGGSLEQGYPGSGTTVYENPVFLNFTHGYDPAETYDLQVATNASFNTPLVANVTLGNDIYGYSVNVNPSTIYYWRVRIHNDATWLSTSFVTAGGNNTPNTFLLNVSTTGTGSGSVTKNPDSTSYHSGTSVTLTATPASGSTFAGWSGDASGTTNPLVVSMTSSKNIIATFNTNIIPPGTFTLNVTNSGSGTGVVTKNPDSVSYHSGTVVQLTAAANSGSAFASWSGDASGNTNPLSVTMTANKNITATFNLTSAPGQTYYVNSANLNTGDGSLANPFKRLDDAVAQSKASNIENNTIIVQGGTYAYFVDVDDSNLTITASSPAAVKRFAIVANNVTISGFTLTNQTSLGAGIIGYNVSNITLNDITATADSAWGGYFINTTGLTINNSSFNSNAASANPFGGIYLQGCSNISFTNVTANNNQTDGFVFNLISNATFTNLTARSNSRYGLNLNESSSVQFVGGNFSLNVDGMHIHPHFDTDINTQDSISGLSFSGTVKADSNSSRGIVLMTDGNGIGGATNDTYIQSPSFSGTFYLRGNSTGALLITGNVNDPTFSGFNFVGSSYGVQITGLSGSSKQPSGVKINNSQFTGYGTTFSNFAIQLADAAVKTKWSNKLVDATNNQWFGLADTAGIKARIWDSVDDNSLGWVNTGGSGFGTPTILIGSASTNTGASVDIPVSLTLFTNATYNIISGKVYYDSTKVKFNSLNFGTGTLFNSAGWSASAGDAQVGATKFKVVSIAGAGATPITTGGTLFKLNFTVIASVADTTNLTGLSVDWNAGAFVVQNGVITYSITPAGPSTLRGDATMNFLVDLNDASAVLSHISSAFLTGQALINADADLNGSITTRDIHYIEYYVLNGNTWPIFLPSVANLTAANTASNNAAGELQFSSPFYQVGSSESFVKVPINIKNATKAFSLEVTFTYNQDKINYQTFKQLLMDTGNLVYAHQLAPGKAKFYFVSGYSYSGDLNPGYITFRFNNGIPEGYVIGTSYKINDGDEVTGPDILLSNNGITAVDGQNTIPTKYEVSQNYPNPFNPSTVIKYSIPRTSLVTVKIYNVLGQEVKTLINAELNPGVYNARWDGDNNFGQKVSSGVYIYRVIAGDFVQVKKMMLLK